MNVTTWPTSCGFLFGTKEVGTALNFVDYFTKTFLMWFAVEMQKEKFKLTFMHLSAAYA